MNAPQAHVDIAAYLLGLLDPADTWRVEQHLAGCDSCRREVMALREVEASLDGVPPELFLDGPDPDADLLLQRTLRKARSESGAHRAGRAGRTFAAAAAAVAVLAVAVGGGVVLGRSGQHSDTATPTPSASSLVPGTRTGAATDPTTGARLSVTVTPAAGWVRVHALVQAVKQGQQCRMIVVSKSGRSEIAGSWVIGPKAAANGLPVDGDALIDPAQVDRVEIVTLDNKRLVSVPV